MEIFDTRMVKLVEKISDVIESFGGKGPLNSENAWTSILYHWFDSSKMQTAFGITPKPARFAIANSIAWSRENGLINK
jgi:dihydroflavonol-4-reductase